MLTSEDQGREAIIAKGAWRPWLVVGYSSLLSGVPDREASLKDDDSRLVEAAVSGDSEAFGMLYERYANHVFTYLYYRLGDRSTAEDLSSEVFLRAWQKIREYRHRGLPFVAWLYRIAHNLLIDHRRRETRRPTVSLGLGPEIPDGQDGPSSISDALRRADLHTAIAALSDDQQQVIVLRFILGMSADEVARVMGRSKGAVEALQHRALKNLRRLIL
jgi:RNA polymerase sigma-70 factor (ECF subfamily)